MADPLRSLISSIWGVDDPVAAGDLGGPRLRFDVAAGGAPRGEVEARALALVAAAPGTVVLRVVRWGGPAATPAWLEGLPVIVDEAPAEDGRPRTILTVTITADHPGLAAALRAALDGVGALDVWAFVGGLLFRFFDGAAVDVWAASDEALEPHRQAFAAWRVAVPGTHRVRCELAFVCDVAWTSMAPTGRSDVRRCGRCDRDVFEVRDEAAFTERAMRGDCVALAPSLLPPGALTSRLLAERGPTVPLAGVPLRPVEPVRMPTTETRRPWWRRLFGRSDE